MIRGEKRILTLVISATIVLAPFTVVHADALSDLLSQKDQLQQQLDANKAASQNKASEAKNLSTQIGGLESDIAAIEAKIADASKQIDATSKNIDELTASINQKQAELDQLKVKLNKAVVEIYRFSSRSDWEILFGAGSLSDSSNQTKYVETVQTQVKGMFDQAQSIKSDLDKQKADQEKKKAEIDALKSQQQSYAKSAQYQKDQKAQLLGMTVQQKAAYDAQVSKLQTEMTHISSQIYAERRKKIGSGGETMGGGGSGYPYSSIDQPDAWGFLTRECTSYAAWYLNSTGRRFVNTRPGQGSAYNWANLARDQGLNVSSSPREGAVIAWGAGPLTSSWGHVAVVESVNSNGTIDLSEYNWVKYAYSYRGNVRPGDYGSYSYIY